MVIPNNHVSKTGTPSSDAVLCHTQNTSILGVGLEVLTSLQLIQGPIGVTRTKMKVLLIANLTIKNPCCFELRENIWGDVSNVVMGRDSTLPL